MVGLYTRCSCRYCRRNRAQHVILNADMILVCFFTTPSLQYRLLFQLPTRNKSLKFEKHVFLCIPFDSQVFRIFDVLRALCSCCVLWQGTYMDVCQDTNRASKMVYFMYTYVNIFIVL